MQIFVEEEALSYSLTREVITKYPYQVISSYQDFKWEGLPDETLLTLGKKRLFLLNFKGKFIKSCPGTKNYLCCGYIIFHIGEGCPLDCSYCILQSYLNRPGLKIWGNLLEEGFPSLVHFLREREKKKTFTRVGTGEFTDSLALESITGISEKLINLWYEEDPFAVLELKTKVAPSEDFFSKLKATPKVIFAWSVNTERVIKEEERGTASLDARLKSALMAIKQGFSVAFHFDPIIYYEEADREYPQVLEKILSLIPTRNIAWISFGTLRFPKALKEIAQKRFPKSKIYSYEFIEGLDLKMRYFIDIRKKIYRSLAHYVKAFQREVTFYFCMESSRIWEEVLEVPIKYNEELRELLDQAGKRLCYS